MKHIKSVHKIAHDAMTAPGAGRLSEANQKL